MEMTLQRLGLENYRPLLKGLVMPIGILALVAMMVLPLPVVLLDTFFVSNILVSLLVLMVAINTQRPLDFSSFPSLVLIATVLRLGLNVASTRIVLVRAILGRTLPEKSLKPLVICHFWQLRCRAVCLFDPDHHQFGGCHPWCWPCLRGVCALHP